MRRLRLGMAGAGMPVVNTKGECNFGQHELNFRYAEALEMADIHAIYRNGAKEIAHQEGYALSFIPKYDEREGNSCHIHLSLWEGESSLFAGEHGELAPAFSRVPGRAAGPHARAVLLPGAEHQLVQALPGRLVRADGARSGGTTTGPAASGSSATATGRGSSAGSPAATRTPTWRSPP